MYLYGKLLAEPDISEDDSALQIVRTALQLWAAADITRRRRKNAITNLDPKSDVLLDDPKAFSSKESDKLFGERFLNGPGSWTWWEIGKERT